MAERLSSDSSQVPQVDFVPELLVAARAAHGWLGSLRHTEQNDQANSTPASGMEEVDRKLTEELSMAKALLMLNNVSLCMDLDEGAEDLSAADVVRLKGKFPSNPRLIQLLITLKQKQWRLNAGQTPPKHFGTQRVFFGMLRRRLGTGMSMWVVPVTATLLSDAISSGKPASFKRCLVAAASDINLRAISSSCHEDVQHFYCQRVRDVASKRYTEPLKTECLQGVEDSQLIFRSYSPARIAYVILAHQFPQNVKRLISRLLQPLETVFAVHVDEKNPGMLEELVHWTQVEALGYAVQVYSKYNIVRGGANMLHAQMEGIRQLLHHAMEWDFCILLSEQDYPLRGNEVLATYLWVHHGTSFVSVDEGECERDVSYQCGDRVISLRSRVNPDSSFEITHVLNNTKAVLADVFANVGVSNTFFPSKPRSQQHMADQFQSWLKHHQFPMDHRILEEFDEFFQSQWPRHREHLKREPRLTHRLLKHLVALIPDDYIIHNEDHANSHLMIYCPNVCNHAAYNTWMDKKTFLSLDKSPEDIKEDMKNRTPSQIIKHYKKLPDYHKPRPYGYIMMKRGKQWSKGRTITAYSNTCVGRILKVAALALQQMLKTIWAHHFGNIATPQLRQEVHQLFQANEEHPVRELVFLNLGNGEVFQQTCGTSMGNQISPILSTCAIVATEITWLRIYGQYAASAHMADQLWIRRYVDNRAIIVDTEELHRNPHIWQLASLHFYNNPVQLEDENHNDLLGFSINANNRQVAYILHIQPWRYRLPQSAGSMRLRLSGYHSRKHMIEHTAYPENIAKEHVYALNDLYYKLAYRDFA
ncbi:Xylosyltransferase 1 [Symbiodinium microadriaticum]|uniref:protein xylosyltransferase n=1 Tax=Symbiodinium microadriaticum TaxID=2951 RepID=A0A1Q9CIF4_SYMMI|nr:Xylosyltransferase 1 [Symbiodinium microadriaticum]